mmetsp:Transcript_45534/g.52637  ORF Transcript_45534/g.52637 Transcript_45534/m.52637 type:complete len:338 (+) Transcript_45534:33-1046(+)
MAELVAHAPTSTIIKKFLSNAPALFGDITLIRIPKIRMSEYNGNEKVYASNPQEVFDKLLKLQEDGVSKLHLMSDFDRTMTLCNYQDIECETSFSVFRRSAVNPDGSSEKFKYTERFIVNVPPPYYYINRVYQRRTEEALNQFVRDRLNLETVEGQVTETSYIARNGLDAFLQYNMKNDVSMSVVSSGILNIIISFCHAFIDVKEYNNLKFYGNALTFNSDGLIDGFKSPVVSPLTKSTVFGYQGTDKRNIFLLGDQLHDVHMNRLLPTKNVIKYGFFNSKKRETPLKIEDYIEKYDVVSHDGNFQIPHLFMRFINGEVSRRELEKVFADRIIQKSD